MPRKRNVFSIGVAAVVAAAVSLSGAISTTPANAYPLTSMGLEFVTTGANEVAEVGLGGDLLNVTIDWGDGTALQTVPDGTSLPDAFYSHLYATPGTYVAVISGTTLSHFGKCAAATNFWNLKRILSWGSLNTTSLKCAAQSRTALTEFPSSLPSTVTDLSYMLYDTHIFNQDLSAWDTSHVTNLERFASNNSGYNKSLGAWDISSVTNAVYMFSGANAFSDTAYSNTLVGWAQQTVHPNLDLGSLTAKATGCNAIEARNTLITAAHWRISDIAPTQSCTAQTVSWAPTNTSGQTGSLTPNAAATGSDLGTISYSVSDAGATGCTVNANSGVLNATSAGTCVIRATAAATPGFYSGATTVTFSFEAPAPDPEPAPTPNAAPELVDTLVSTGSNTVGILVLALGGIGLGIVVLLVIFIIRRRKL